MTTPNHLLLLVTLVLLVALTHGEVCSTKYSCTGCSQVKICRETSSGYKETFHLTCTGDKPYCHEETGTCTNVPNQNCADKGVFLCMQDGSYPDPVGCKQYHVCKDDVSFTFPCPEYTAFDGYTCGSWGSCETFDCSRKTNIKVAHPNNRNVFAYCLHNKPLFVDRCPEGENLDFDSQQCYIDETTTEDTEEETTRPYYSHYYKVFMENY